MNEYGVVYEECRRVTECQYCFCEGLPDRTVVFLTVGPHGRAYALKEPAVEWEGASQLAHEAEVERQGAILGGSMKNELINLMYEIDLQPGEKLALPESLVNVVGAGRWLVTVRPLDQPDLSVPIRNHNAFLNSYAPEDEGLYDNNSAR